MLRGFEPRLYQQTILATAATKNTLVVLPTGLGKTGIALLLAVQRLKTFPESKVLFLAPTKPLAEQHLQTFKKHIELEESRFALFTGEVTPEKRAEAWKDIRLVFSTPQGMENDVISGKISLKDVSLLVFDEAHRAVGDYSYAFIAKQYSRNAAYPRILALTASPGSEVAKIEEVCKNLYIEAVEIRTDSDPDVRPYIQPIDIELVKVELPEQFKQIRQLLNSCIKERKENLEKFGVNIRGMSKKDILSLQAQLHAQIAAGQKDFQAFKAISLLAELVKASHTLELLETQGLTALKKYFEKLWSEAANSKVKAVKRLAGDLNFKSAFALTQELLSRGIEHPKLGRMRELVAGEVKANPMIKIILFTQYRDSAVRIAKELESVPGAIARIFVGQAKKGETGMSQKEQQEMLDLFRDGMFNVLIATSVAEEGLDIPRVDLVLFYEPIPSAIRHIQRRGRTGRQEKGRVIILITKGTRDEAYSWSAHRKEGKMHFILEQLRKELNARLAPQQAKLQTFGEKPKIFVDYREKGSIIAKELLEQGVDVKLEMLHSADYVVSTRVGVEVKTTEDFVNSIIDGRLLEQLKTLKKSYDRPILILEGEQGLYTVRNVHPNSIRGMLATIAVDFGIPILQTKNSKESAEFLRSLALREQSQEGRDFSPHANRKPLTLKEQQEYLVSAMPGIGLSLAQVLLKHFGSVQAIFSASEDGLQSVPGVGKKTAERIRRVAGSSYEEK